MKNKAQLKSVILCGVGIILIGLFIFLTLRGNKDPSEPENTVAIHEEVNSNDDPEKEKDPSPDINTNTGANESKITPGGIEYSFIDTTGMTEEEIAELETRLDEEAEYSYEPNTNIGRPENTQGMYLNTERSCTFPSGSVLKIGVNLEYADALYLNPVYEAVEEENIFSEGETAFAFYLKTMFGEDVSTSSNVQMTYDVSSASDIKYFVITDRTYDTLVPAGYTDSVNYGVKWNDLNNYHGFDGSDYDMEIRVVRLPDGQLMGTAKMHISFDVSGKYSVTSLVYSDVAATGELTEDKRSEAIERAFAFFCGEDKGQSTFVDQTYWEAYKIRAVVEKVDNWLYFPRLFDASGNVASAGKFSGMDAYAVNINYPGYGFATVYVAPQQQINGLRGSTDASDDLQPFAFDALKPFSRTTLFVPEYQKEDFFK